MSERYPGGIISKTPPTITGPTDGEGGSASGMWNLTDVAENEKAGTWPKKILSRSLFITGVISSGQGGLNDTVARSSPTQLGSTSDAYKVAHISNSTGFFIRQDGTLWASGANSGGALGLNDVVNRSSPVQVGALTDWAAVGGDQQFCIATKTDGTLWSWGRNADGAFGDNSVNNIYRSSPVQVGTNTDWARPLTSQPGCTKTDGSLYMWGSNNTGRLGQNDGFAIPRSSPVQVAGTWASGEKWTNSEQYTLAIKSDGTLWAWGDDNNGNLGQSVRNIDRSSPVQIGALTDWTSVSTGTGNSRLVMATRSNGTAWYWGWDRFSSGTAGINLTTYLNSSPVQIGSDTDWEFVLSRNFYCFWKKTDGTFYGTGSGFSTNYYGQLGLNDGVLKSSPVQLGWVGTRENSTLGDLYGSTDSTGALIFKD